MRRRRIRRWWRQEVLGALERRLRPVFYMLAYVWRRLLAGTTFIAVTGSLGKTTTKECLATVLGSRYRTFRTWRNQNGASMVALNILRVRPWHRFAVLEVAAAGPGTMRKPSRLVAPDVAILLPVEATHSTEYRDLDERAAEKEELVRALRPDGVALLATDDPRIRRMASRTSRKVIGFGTGGGAEVSGEEASSAWPGRLRFRVRSGPRTQWIETRLVGEHWVPAALGTVAAAEAVGMGLGEISQALREAAPFPGRMQPVRLENGAVLLRDDYNASVAGTLGALRVLGSASAKRRIFVLTDISDYAGNRRRRLRFLAPEVARVSDAAVIIGDQAAWGARRFIDAGMAASGVHGFGELREAAEFLRGELRDGDLALLKGRTTDHAARVALAQFGEVRCWKSYCPKRMLCDICWELGLSDEEAERAATVE